jgi:hypothetical protein
MCPLSSAADAACQCATALPQRHINISLPVGSSSPKVGNCLLVLIQGKSPREELMQTTDHFREAENYTRNVSFEAQNYPFQEKKTAENRLATHCFAKNMGIRGLARSTAVHLSNRTPQQYVPSQFCTVSD